MYNSSLKSHGKDIVVTGIKEIPGKVFYNDMSVGYSGIKLTGVDVIYSEIAWPYGYKGFNEKADNSPRPYAEYIENINELIEQAKVPTFIVCGKNVKKHFPKAQMYPITIDTAGENIKGCTLYVWNYDEIIEDRTTKMLAILQRKYRKCLDMSCGYGTHLLGFEDFIACDINKSCLTYLAIACEGRAKEWQDREKK